MPLPQIKIKKLTIENKRKVPNGIWMTSMARVRKALQ